jgi:hypothetical protein
MHLDLHDGPLGGEDGKRGNMLTRKFTNGYVKPVFTPQAAVELRPVWVDSQEERTAVRWQTIQHVVCSEHWSCNPCTPPNSNRCDASR